MTSPSRAVSVRLSAEESSDLHELGQRLGTSATETLKLALRELSKATGLLRLDIEFIEAVVGEHGEDAVLTFHLPGTGDVVDTTINGQPVQGLEAHRLSGGSTSMILARETGSGVEYLVTVPDGSQTVEVAALKLLDFTRHSDNRVTPDARREGLRESARIRRVAAAVRREAFTPDTEDGHNE